MKGLAPEVSKIFEKVSKLECIKPFVLVGGTALSLQIDKRLSEDLDFMRWKTGPKDKLEIGWPSIKKELSTIGKLEEVDILDLDQALFTVDRVKLSFYAAPRRRIPTMQEITVMNNLRVADIKSIGAMKMETMSRRRKFRDYYDIYSILKEGVDIKELVSLAIQHSGNALKTKNLLAMLSYADKFVKDKNFEQLSPKYNVSSRDIQDYIISVLEKSREEKRFSDIDNELKKTATIYKAKDGSVMLRATIGDNSFNVKLSTAELDEVKIFPNHVKELAVSKFHDKAKDMLEIRNNERLQIK